jgi:hypothetical protein
MTQLFWRITPSNQCGVSPESPVFTFTTRATPGDCGPGTNEVVYFANDMESGASGWTHSAATGPDTWVLDDTDANSPANSWNVTDVGEVSDQRLESPEVAVPPGINMPTLQFYNKRDIEENGDSACWDGGILEYSNDSGNNWTQIDNSRLETDQYTGPVGANSGNPLANLDAWCGARDWDRSVVDLSGLEGQDLKFRFRLGTDSLIEAGLWHIDDVVVQSCEPGADTVFEHGFEDSDIPPP